MLIQLYEKYADNLESDARCDDLFKKSTDFVQATTRMVDAVQDAVSAVTDYVKSYWRLMAESGRPSVRAATREAVVSAVLDTVAA
jgi:hypothetical protein